MKYANMTLMAYCALFLFACDLQKQNEATNVTQKIENLIEKSSLDINVMTITGINNNEIQYQIKDGWLAGWAEQDKGTLKGNGISGFGGDDEVCRGGGISFARCVKKQLDKGNCLKLYKENGEYVAEKTVCKEEGIEKPDKS